MLFKASCCLMVMLGTYALATIAVRNRRRPR
jgi:hypothetical protein